MMSAPHQHQQQPQSQSSPSRPGSIASLPMTYSMDSDHQMQMPAGAPTRQHSPSHSRQQTPTQQQQQQQQSQQPLPPAYAFQRSERTDNGGGTRGGGGGGGGGATIDSFATTEDTISYNNDHDAQSMDTRSVDYTEDSTPIGSYEGLNQQSQSGTNNNNNNLDQYYQHQEADQQNLATVNEYQTMGTDNNNFNSSMEEGEEDATSTIYKMHENLLRLLSSPELFHEALEWQDKIDRGLLMLNPEDGIDIDHPDDKDVSRLTSTFNTEFDDDSTFQGLGDNNNNNNNNNDVTKATQNETFEFNPNDTSTSSSDNSTQETKDASKKDEAARNNNHPTKRPLPPLPHQIFAPDAEVVLPQALTASQLFGIERVTGIELEAAAGIAGASQLFLRWLALMPEGDHENVIDPPGLTVMKISGGGYRVTGAHRVVWRWMNKFSPASTGQSLGGTASPDDFDFGDLVTMTIIDVFETDTRGKLLSYCPTFDNRAVHKTPEMAERLRKGATQLKQTMEVVAKSPAGKSMGTFGKMGFRAAMVVGNAVKNKIQQQKNAENNSAAAANGNVAEEDQLNELLHSQIVGTEDETDVDINDAMNAAALEDDPTRSPNRRMEV